MTPIDERLRAGLVANTDHLLSDLDHELSATYDRARGRQRVRRGAFVLATAAAIAVTAWVVDLPGLDGDAVPPVTPDPTPTDLVGVQGPLEPGRYSMAAWGQTEQAGGPLPRAVLDVPEGYFSNGGYVVDAGLDGVTDDQRGDLSVYGTRCRSSPTPASRRSAADVGPTVEDLARALVRQAGPSTRPRPVVLDGQRGRRDGDHRPAGRPTSPRCPFGEYSLCCTKARGTAPTPDHRDVVNHLWILDVDGTRLVVVASLYPDEDPAQHQEQLAMAESIHFVRHRLLSRHHHTHPPRKEKLRCTLPETGHDQHDRTAARPDRLQRR